MNCSITGDALCCSLRFNNVVIISNESLNLYLWSLTPLHLSATLQLYQLVNEVVGSSEYLCSAGGKFCNHSAEFLMCVGNKGSRLGVILSHMNRILQVCTVHQW